MAQGYTPKPGDPGTGQGPSPPIRIIKKYPNRRLYDTTLSRYVTREDIRDLVRSQVAFQVVDARTHADLTHATLLQIIAEQEEKGGNLLPTAVLEALIRSYGHAMQEMMGPFIAESLRYFQHQWTQAPPTGLEAWHPTPWIQWIAQQQHGFWQAFQPPVASQPPSDPTHSPHPDPASPFDNPSEAP